MNKNSFIKLVLGIYLLINIFGCEDVFDYSPFESKLPKDQRDLTNKNLRELLKNTSSNHNNFKFAVIADIHNWYDDLADFVDHINKNTEIKFLFLDGDLTDRGIQKEYDLLYITVDKLNIPYFTAIGNHEYYKVNGLNIYRSMFGEENYSFVFRNNKFIVFDSNLGDGTFDLNWLNNEISDETLYNSVFVITHCPPFSDTFNDQDYNKNEFADILANNKIILIIFGHEHYYSYDEITRYLVVEHLEKRNYCIITIKSNSYEIERIYF